MNIQKSIVLLGCLLTFHFTFVNAQALVQEEGDEEGRDSVKVMYLENYYAMYQSLSEARWGIYVNLIADNSLAPGELGGLRPFNNFGVEHVLGNRMSIYGEVNFRDVYFLNQSLDALTTFSLQGRYFFKTKKDQFLQRTKTNLTGPFASMGYLYQVRDELADGQGFRLATGWQNRFFQYGYYLLSLELTGIYGLTRVSFEATPNRAEGSNRVETTGWIFRLMPKINMGVSLGERPQSLPNCAILSCHRVRNSLFKWNFLTLMPLLGQLQSTSLEFENKIEDTPLTLVSGVSFRFLDDRLFNFSDRSSSIRSQASAIRLFIEPRYYWNLDRRSLKGEAGSGFSANFVGLELLVERGAFRSHAGENLIQKSRSGFSSLFLNHGWQREFGKNFWVQARLGLAYTQGDVLWIEQSRIVNSNLFRPAGDIKCGIYL